MLLSEIYFCVVLTCEVRGRDRERGKEVSRQTWQEDRQKAQSGAERETRTWTKPTTALEKIKEKQRKIDTRKVATETPSRMHFLYAGGKTHFGYLCSFLRPLFLLPSIPLFSFLRRIKVSVIQSCELAQILKCKS